MKEYRVHFTQTFSARGYRTVVASDRDEAIDAVFHELLDDPAFEEIDKDDDIDIDEIEEL